MMNIIDMQNNLKGLTDQQLVGEMQQPTGQVPQYLVLAELTRRKDMRDEFAKRQADSGKTVAENAIAAAGFPQGGIASLSGMAPRTDLSMNDAAPMMGQPPQPAPPPPTAEVRGMADGGIVGMQQGGMFGGAGQHVQYYGRNYVIQPSGKVIDMTGGKVVFDENLANAIKNMAAPETAMIPQGVRPITGNELPPDIEPGGIGTLMYETLNQDWQPSRMGDEWFAQGRINERERLALERGSIGEQKKIVNSMIARGDTPAPDVPLDDADIGGAFGGWTPTPAIPTHQQSPTPVEISETSPSPSLIETFSAGFTPSSGASAGPYELGVEVAGPTTGIDNWPLGVEVADGGQQLDAEQLANRDAISAMIANIGVNPEDSPVGEDVTGGQPMPVPQAAAVGGGGAGGGGTSGGGAAGGASGFSSYEQFLQKRLDDLTRQKDKDKWLALAMAGAQLMASDNPSFGGAIGEAFQTGLGAYKDLMTKADEEEMDLMMKKLQLSAASAGGGGGGASGGRSSGASAMTGIPASLLDDYLRNQFSLEDDIRKINSDIVAGGMTDDTGYWVPYTEEQLAAKTRQRDYLTRTLEAAKLRSGSTDFYATE